jgi:outer membrane biosynthesis protein TonB
VTTAARKDFDGQELTIAFAVALLAQLVFVAVFSLPSPKLIQAEISNDNAQPIAVAITPVLKLGSKNPTKLPSQWQRKQPVAPKPTEPTALPSPQAQKTPEAIPTTHVPDASVAPVPVEAGAPDQPTTTTAAPAGSESVATASSTQGSEQGAANGTETDPLKGRAADMYRQQIASWFMARFNIRGKIPFDKLKTLRALAVVSVTPDRKVGSFSIVKPSGDPTFDAQVQATLSGAQSSGAELPAPPPMYPEFLAKSQSLRFECTVEKLCE